MRYQALSEERRAANEEHADPRKGLKKVATKISSHTANSLRYVVRDDKTCDGRKEGTLTANPKTIDVVITRAWQTIYEGNVTDVDAMVEDFMEKVQENLVGAKRVPNGRPIHTRRS